VNRGKLAYSIELKSKQEEIRNDDIKIKTAQKGVSPQHALSSRVCSKEESKESPEAAQLDD